MNIDDLHYENEIWIGNDKIYGKVISFLGDFSMRFEDFEDGMIYFFDEAGGQIVKTNSNRTIKLTDKVGNWLPNGIRHIIHNEKIKEWRERER